MDVNFLFRLERNRRLAKCDWTQGNDSPLTTDKKTEWATYRQALRDLPASSTPKLGTMEELLLSSTSREKRILCPSGMVSTPCSYLSSSGRGLLFKDSKRVFVL